MDPGKGSASSKRCQRRREVLGELGENTLMGNTTRSSASSRYEIWPKGTPFGRIGPRSGCRRRVATEV